MQNSYLEEVLQQQVKVDNELKRAAPRKSMSAATRAPGEAAAAPTRSADYRITGWWRWRTVVVAPNVYVVHTRRGHEKPLHIGMGTSFRFDPNLDSFLVIPAVMQTIIINARCICIEKQGVLVQAYVQWIIDDIEVAYRKLDFSDADDPMRIVNVQLREQAEAAIKDKVATMSIDDVLSDKQSIIVELTHRLRAVAEGSESSSGGGLGLKIVTVQIKEAVVSSPAVWDNLQRPFRADRAQRARLAELEAEKSVTQHELDNRRERESAELATHAEIERLRADEERRAFDRGHGEQRRRQQLEQEAARLALAEESSTRQRTEEAALELHLLQLELQKKRLAAELALAEQELIHAKSERELVLARAQLEIDLEQRKHLALCARELETLKLAKTQREIDNNLSDNELRRRVVEQLPEIVAKLPAPKEQRVISIGDANANTLLPSLAVIGSLLGDALVELKPNTAASKE
ncbi:MAG: SPFH domain-containing protein [Myxococcota bacterium]|jgi:hypothetical protein|nr:SPFH domain-containing protein [Myxococcota bacterium]